MPYTEKENLKGANIYTVRLTLPVDLYAKKGLMPFYAYSILDPYGNYINEVEHFSFEVGSGWKGGKLSCCYRNAANKITRLDRVDANIEVIDSNRKGE